MRMVIFVVFALVPRYLLVSTANGFLWRWESQAGNSSGKDGGGGAPALSSSKKKKKKKEKPTATTTTITH